MSKDVVVLNNENWKREVAEAEGPVLVDFWAEWCPPCRMIAPAVEALATTYAGRAKVAKLNVDESPEVANAFGVRSIPTLLVFRGGQGRRRADRRRAAVVDRAHDREPAGAEGRHPPGRVSAPASRRSSSSRARPPTPQSSGCTASAPTATTSSRWFRSCGWPRAPAVRFVFPHAPVRAGHDQRRAAHARLVRRRGLRPARGRRTSAGSASRPRRSARSSSASASAGSPRAAS